MTRRILPMLIFVLIATAAFADGGLIPLTPEQGGERQGVTVLRGAHTLTLYQRPDAEPLRLTVDARRIGSYEDPVVASWPADAEVTRRSVSVEPGETGELVLAECEPGPVQVRVDGGLNAAVVESNGPLAIPAASDGPDGAASFVSHVGTLYFFVPADTERFTAYVRGQGHEENATLTIFAPDGAEAASGTTIGSQGAELRVDVPQEHAGAVWSLTAAKPETGIFEDCVIALGREIPQYLSLRPDGVLVPFVTGVRQPPRYVGSETEPTVRFALTRSVESGTLAAETSEGDTITVDATEGAIDVPVTDTTRQVTVSLSSPELPHVQSTTAVSLRGSMLFVGGYQPLVGAEAIGEPTKETGVRISQALQDPPPGLTLEASLRRSHPSRAPSSLAAEVVQRERFRDWDGAAVELMPDETPADGAYEWEIVLRDEQGALLDWTRTAFVQWDGTYFADRTPEAAQVAPAWARSRWLSFAPEAADAIPYRYRPSRGDVERRIHMMATPGEFESATVGVLALDRSAGMRVDAPELRAPGGERIPAEAWEVRWARYWPQRTDWNSTAFETIP
ncbi:MAG: hypothetical protein ACOCZ7_03670, partial [Armatimonadota bacterium]